MDTATNVAKFLSQSIAPVAQSGLTMDMYRKAWVTELRYLTTGFASQALEAQMGPPDGGIPGFSKRWSFAGCTVTQRGRLVMIAEHF